MSTKISLVARDKRPNFQREVKAKRVSPEKGLGTTYHAQADCGQVYGDGSNKYNWACAKCGKVYLNRWKAIECFDSHKEVSV